MYCLECDCAIDKAVYTYSTNNFGIPLCRPHQQWVKEKEKVSTHHAMQLYFLLKEQGIHAELEKHDGYKTVDIVIEEAKVHIEVDGAHHNFDKGQALADLKRTFYSFKKGYLTLRIPNSLICNETTARETAKYLADFLEISKKRQKPEPTNTSGIKFYSHKKL